MICERSLTLLHYLNLHLCVAAIIKPKMIPTSIYQFFKVLSTPSTRFLRYDRKTITKLGCFHTWRKSHLAFLFWNPERLLVALSYRQKSPEVAFCYFELMQLSMQIRGSLCHGGLSFTLHRHSFTPWLLPGPCMEMGCVSLGPKYGLHIGKLQSFVIVESAKCYF